MRLLLNHLSILGLLEKAGLKPADVTLVNTPPQEMPVALLANSIDAFVGWDPFPIAARATRAGLSRRFDRVLLEDETRL